jgi:hypothetical protein
MTTKILDFKARAKPKSEPCRHSPPWAIDSRGWVAPRLRALLDEARGETEALRNSGRASGLTGFFVGLVAGLVVLVVLGLGRG